MANQRYINLLKKINELQQKFILQQATGHTLYEDLLKQLLHFTSSEIGFIALPNAGSQLQLRILAASDNLSLPPNTLLRLKSGDPDNITHYLGAALHAGKPVYANQQVENTSTEGLSLHNYLSFPVLKGHKIIGIWGVANSTENYQQKIIEELEPFNTGLSSFIQSHQAREAKPVVPNPTPAPASVLTASLSAQEGHWEWDPTSGGLQVSNFSEWSGKNQITSLRQLISQHIHPDDVPLLIKNLRDNYLINARLTLQCRIKISQNAYRWFRLSVRATFDEHQRLKSLNGSLRDIHQFKTSQSRNTLLHQQAQSLSQKMMNNRQDLRQVLKDTRELRQRMSDNDLLLKDALSAYGSFLSYTPGEANEVSKQKNRLEEERLTLNKQLNQLTEELEQNLQESTQLRKQLRDRDQLLRKVVDNYSDFFIVFDNQRRVKYINRITLEFLGMQEEEVIGQQYINFLPNTLFPVYDPKLREAYAYREERSFETRIPSSTGHKDVLVRYLPQLDDSGQVDELLAISFDLSVQKKQEREILKTKEQYHYLFRHSPQPMWIYDLQTLRFMDVNNAAISRYGWSKEEFLEMTIQDIRPEDSRLQLSSFVSSKISNYSNSGIWPHLLKDGSRIAVEITSHEITFNGKKARMVLAHDVSERLQAEQNLLDSQTNLKATIDNGLVSLVLLDKKGRIVLSDQLSEANARKFVGKPLKPGKYFKEFVPEDLISSFHKNFEKALQGEKVSLERMVTYSPESNFWLDISYSPVINSEGEVTGVVYSALDITEKKIAQNQLVESEANLQAIFDATIYSYFLLDKNYHILKFNEMAAKSVSITQNRKLNEGDNMLDYFKGEEVDSFKKNIAKALEGEKVMLEREIKHPQASFWYNVQYLPVKNKQGYIYGVAFVFMDITQQKDTELALKKTYQDVQTFKNVLYDSALISATNLKGEITEVNANFCEVAKYSREELIGQPHSILKSDYHPSSFFKELWDTITRGHSWRGEIKNKAKDGSYYWVDTYIHPIRDEEGQVYRYLSVRYLITDRKEAEEEIKKYAHRLDDILENITDGFFTVDREWRFTRVNRVFEKTLQRKRSDLIGENIWEAFPKAVKLKFYEKYSKTMEDGIAVHFEEYFPPLDLWFEAHAYPAEDGISVYFRDITRRKKSEEEIRKLSMVASKTDNTVIITNALRQIEWVNEGFTKLTGYAFDEVIGRNPGHFLQGPETDQQTIERIRQKLNRNKSTTEELINYNKQGEKYWIKMDITPILDENGQIEKFIAIQSDITERKHAELEKAKLVEELISKNKSLEEYAFITSHNLRAPIAHILGLTSLFDKENPTDPFHTTVIEQLGNAAENLDTVIMDITNLLAVRNDNVRIKELIPLEEVIISVLDNLRNQVEQTGAQITYQLDDVQEAYGVRDYLHSILLNLLSNAIKYRHPDRRPEIKVVAFLQEQHICITVNDNALGINLNKYGSKLFSLYSRFHAHVEGKGIGLHMVKTLAEAMGGSVEVESQEGVGSTFSLYIPVGRA
jgi:PAS domain S-box-containing protein